MAVQLFHLYKFHYSGVKSIYPNYIHWMLKFWKSISWAAFTLILLLIPADRLPEKGLLNIPHLDKMVHFLLFAVLGYLVLLDLKRPLNFFRPYILPVLLVIIFACLTEIVQLIVGFGRLGDLYDLAADSAGAIAGVLIYRLRAR